MNNYNYQDKKSRVVKEFDHIKGHFLSKKNKNNDIDFYIVTKENAKLLDCILKDEQLEPTIVCYTDTPLGIAIYDKMIDTTFIVGDSKFYIDSIESLKEIIEQNKKNKAK